MNLKFYFLILVVSNSLKAEQHEFTEAQTSSSSSPKHEKSEDFEDKDEIHAKKDNFTVDNSTKEADTNNNTQVELMGNITEGMSSQRPPLNENEDANLEIDTLGVTPQLNYQPPNIFVNKNRPLSILGYFNPSNIIRPISQHISKLSTFLTAPYNPNNGIVNFLNPSYLLQKISDKGQQFLSNSNSAIFGFGQTGGHDYPYPYKSTMFSNTI